MANHELTLSFEAREESDGKVLPAGSLKVWVNAHTKTVEVAGHQIGSGTVEGQAIALKTLVFAAGELAKDLGFTLDQDYIERVLENESRDRREAYTAAVERY